jgi:hypothetical protein
MLGLVKYIWHKPLPLFYYNIDMRWRKSLWLLYIPSFNWVHLWWLLFSLLFSIIYNKSLDADGMNEILHKFIKVLLYKEYIVIRVYDFTEIIKSYTLYMGILPILMLIVKLRWHCLLNSLSCTIVRYINCIHIHMLK